MTILYIENVTGVSMGCYESYDYIIRVALIATPYSPLISIASSLLCNIQRRLLHCTEQHSESTTNEGVPTAEGLPEEARALVTEEK